jgi:hypothetical protein
MANVDFINSYNLNDVVEKLERPASFILDTLFPKVMYNEGDSLYIEREKGLNDLLARATLPDLDPTYRTRNANDLIQVNPAYYQEASFIKPSDTRYRLFGEAFGGNLSAQERLARLITRETEKLLSWHENRLEKLACDALLAGTYTVFGEKYPSSTVNFGRSNTLMPTALSGTARWWDVSGNTGGSAANVKQNIQTAIDLIKGFRGRPKKLILGDNARKGFEFAIANNAEFKQLFDSNFRVSMATGNLDPKTHDGAELVTTFAGNQYAGLQVWSYSKMYTDDAGVQQDYFNPNQIALVDDTSYVGTQYFSLIENFKSMRAEKVFVRIGEMQNGKGYAINSESSPLIYPVRPNMSLSWTVAS